MASPNSSDTTLNFTDCGLSRDLQTTYGRSKTPSRICHELYGHFYKYSVCSSGLLHGRFTCFVPPTFISLGQPCQMQHIGNCYPPRPCRCLVCVSEHSPPFATIFHGSSSDPKKHDELMNVVGIQRPICGFEGLVDPTLILHISHFF